MIWTSCPILYSQIDEILHDLDELFLFSSNSKTQTLFDHFVVFSKKIRVSTKIFIKICRKVCIKTEFPTKICIKICRKVGVKIEFPTNYSRFSILK